MGTQRFSASSLAFALATGALLGAAFGTIAMGALGPQRAAGGAAPASGGPAPASPVATADNEQIEMLLGVLVDEVRSLRTSLSAQRSAAPGSPEVALAQPELTASLDALTRALTRSGGGGLAGFGSPGRGLTTLEVPDRTTRWDRLNALLDIENDDERIRPYLLWNYQQVLDHFGRPTTINATGYWSYHNPNPALPDVEMRFAQGLLIYVD